MNIKNKSTVKIIGIALFYLISIGIRYLFVIYKPPFLASIANTHIYGILTGIGPLVGALFVILLFKRKIEYSNFGLSAKKTLLSASIPMCLFFLYDLIKGNYSFSNTLVVVVCLIYGYCEEFGWRGYLQSELINLSTLRRVLIITLMWFLWHLNFDINQQNVLFLLILFFSSWGIGQIAINTKSIIVCGCFHAIFNVISNMQMDLIKTTLIVICLLCWFGIWYLRHFKKHMI